MSHWTRVQNTRAASLRAVWKLGLPRLPPPPSQPPHSLYLCIDFAHARKAESSLLFAQVFHSALFCAFWTTIKEINRHAGKGKWQGKVESGNWKLDRGILQKDVVGVSWQATHNNWCLKGLHICLHWERGRKDSRRAGRMLQRTSASSRPEWSICKIFQFNELRAESVEKGLSGGWKQTPGTVG